MPQSHFPRSPGAIRSSPPTSTPTTLAAGSTPRPRAVPLLVTLIIVVLSVSVQARASSDQNDLDVTVISCEEALAKLSQCCSRFEPTRIRCNDRTFNEGGCDSGRSGHYLPAYTLAESECIRETPCAELVAHGVCTRAAEVTSRGTSHEYDDYYGTRTDWNGNDEPAVCP